MSDQVQGYCPMGCGQTLFLGSGGYVTCSWYRCPNPTAVSDLLADQETNHVVVIIDGEYTVKHPIRERIGDELLSCGVVNSLQSIPAPVLADGKYRASGGPEQYTWEKIA